LVPISAFPGEPADGGAGDDGGEVLLDGGQQGLALAGAFLGEGGVAAGDEPLAGEIIRRDLGEILLIEQRQLQRPVVVHQLPDRGGAAR
jgi:hypothetical protein